MKKVLLVSASWTDGLTICHINPFETANTLLYYWIFGYAKPTTIYAHRTEETCLHEFRENTKETVSSLPIVECVEFVITYLGLKRLSPCLQKI